MFRTDIKARIKSFAFEELMKKKNNHSKLKDLFYNGLETQQYLLDEETSKEMKITAFKWRTRSEKFEENFRGGKKEVLCFLCKKHRDTQPLSLTCEEIKKSIDIYIKYDEIFEAKVPRRVLETLTRISKVREANREK